MYKKIIVSSVVALSVIAAGGLAYRAQAEAPLSPPGLTVAESHIPVCSHELPGDARCHARVVVDKQGKPLTTSIPAAYGPAQFRTAYGLTSSIGSPAQVIAIVDAYDHPRI